MNKEEFNKLSNFEKLSALCACPCYAPRYVNGKKHRLYIDSCKYLKNSEHYDDNWNIISEPCVVIVDTTFPIPCYKDNKDLTIIAEHDSKIDDIDYEDIYDNVDDYEYPYNHINKGEL